MQENKTYGRLGRRDFLALAAGTGASLAIGEAKAQQSNAGPTTLPPVQVPARLQAPYRVWGGAEFFICKNSL